MNELSLFTGVGGGLLGTVHLLGWRPIGYVEIDTYCQRVLAQRIKDGFLPEAPIFGDIRAFISEGYAEAYQGMVDCLCAGFPCQPFSVAGHRQGESDERNLWPETIDTIRLVRPRYCLLENVPGLLASGYFGTILGDLADSGYNCRWKGISAERIGAPIVRERLFIIAIAYSGNGEERLGHFPHRQRQIRTEAHRRRNEFWLQAPPSSPRVVNGVANYLERVGAIGNGQVPAVVRAAWEILSQEWPE